MAGQSEAEEFRGSSSTGWVNKVGRKMTSIESLLQLKNRSSNFQN